jgi:hypothetical protein
MLLFWAQLECIADVVILVALFANAAPFNDTSLKNFCQVCPIL